MQKYVIGIDFGTESGRVLLVDVETGKEISNHLTLYRDGVIDEYLPGMSLRLPAGFALQNPDDYLAVLYTAVPAVLKVSGVNPEQIIGIGIAFTACTMLPGDESLRPLCTKPEWRSHPHAWVKLWKHHAAQDRANRLNQIAREQREKWLVRYGNKISSEWMIPKVWQILDEAPDIYEAADQFVEATDWVVAQMTGRLARNSCTAGYKAMWHKQDGYPTEEFFESLDPRMKTLTTTKLRGHVAAIGETAGGLLPSMAEKMGLLAGTAVAVGNVDAHAAVPAVGVVTPGKMVMVMGTSICHMVLSREEKAVEGMCGVVEDGIIPGLYGYEAGQSAVGDIFAWYVEQGIPAYVEAEAEEAGLNVHQYLEQQAAKLCPGESGLVALDWHNGNRSVLVDSDLTGVLVGVTLLTKPAEIYRALLEATAYGTRMIVEAFHNNRISIDELYACGGLPQRNRLLMQIFADVTNLPIRIAESTHTPAAGAAMFGAVAAGKENGGYDSIVEASRHMARLKDEIITPIPENVAKYELLFQEYKELHDYFGRGGNDVMKRLKRLREGTD